MTEQLNGEITEEQYVELATRVYRAGGGIPDLAPLVKSAHSKALSDAELQKAVRSKLFRLRKRRDDVPDFNTPAEERETGLEKDLDVEAKGLEISALKRQLRRYETELATWRKMDRIVKEAAVPFRRIEPAVHTLSIHVPDHTPQTAVLFVSDVHYGERVSFD